MKTGPRRWELIVDSSNGGTSLTPMVMVVVQSLERDCQFGFCPECLMVLSSPYWGARQCRGLHERGSGHRTNLRGGRIVREDVVKALTLWQPHASLIAHDVKRVETRSWQTRYRGRLAIHAAARRPVEWEEVGDYRVHECMNGWRAFKLDDGEETGASFALPLGVVVALCLLVDCVPVEAGSDWGAYGDFTAGRWAWILDDVELLDVPITARGQQGLWNWSPS